MKKTGKSIIKKNNNIKKKKKKKTGKSIIYKKTRKSIIKISTPTATRSIQNRENI